MANVSRKVTREGMTVLEWLGPDEIAETLDGVSDLAYEELWTFVLRAEGNKEPIPRAVNIFSQLSPAAKQNVAEVVDREGARLLKAHNASQ